MELELELDQVSAYDDFFANDDNCDLVFHAFHDLILSSEANQF